MFNFKEKAQEALIRLVPKLTKVSTESLYATLCAATFYPLAQAMQAGDGAADKALVALAANIGANLIAGRIQKAQDTTEVREEIKQKTQDFMQEWKDPSAAELAIAGLPADDPIRLVLDSGLLDADAVQVVQQRMADEDRAWFTEMLQKELKQLGNYDRFEATLHVSNSVARDIIGVQHIVNHYYARGGSAEDKARLSAQIISYLKWVQEHYQYIVMRGIEKAGGPRVVMLPLSSAYVPLEATVVVQPADESLKNMVGKVLRRLKGEEPAAEMPHTETYDVALNEVLRIGARLAIIGGPGCGKTTVLAHMAWALATSLLDPANDAASSRLGISGELPLPILVPLASFNRHRRNLPVNASAHEHSLARYISTYLIKSNSGIALPEDFFERLLEDGQSVMLLLDGLDEVANADDRKIVRQAVETLVAGKDKLRTIVTCRTIAYKSTPLGANFKDILVKPLDFEQHVTPMVRKAHECIHPNDPKAARDRSDYLLSEIEKLEADRRAVQGRDADRLVDSPLMVRLLIIVDYNERKLPDERAKLFDKAVEALIVVDFHLDEEVSQMLAGDWETRREMLQHLAFHMHLQGADQGREIEMRQLKRLLSADPEYRSQLNELVMHIQNRGGLLEERDGVCRFIHLAFQEFLTGRYLREVKIDDGLDAIVTFLEDGRLSDPWWREPILLNVGYTAAKSQNGARSFLRKLITAGTTPDERLTAAELAGLGALEWRESGAGVKSEIAARITELYADDMLMSVAAPMPRAHAGQTLARLDDPRDYALHVDAMRLCLVPRGCFSMGSPKDDKQSFDDERPTAPDFMVETYAIGQHPVTQAQFFEFVTDGGYKQAQWWTAAQAAGCWENGEVIRRVLYYEEEQPNSGSTRRKIAQRFERDKTPRDFGEPYSLSNHPVVGINWYEALAFCEWLTARWRAKGWLQGKQCVRLPNEPEWEKAARGGDLIPIAQPVVFDVQHQIQYPDSSALFHSAKPVPRVYPYGDKVDTARANIGSTNIDSTNPLGCFGNGASVYGCHDLSGNVWEWTRSAYGPWQLVEGDYKVTHKYGYPYDVKDGREEHESDVQMARVLRGGAFYNYEGSARCASRLGSPPLNRYDFSGFRVVVSPF